MNKIESSTGNNFAITKEVMMLMSKSLNSIFQLYAGRSDLPTDENNFGLIISGINEILPTADNPVILGSRSSGLVYFKGELIEFRAGVYQSAFSVIEDVTTISGSDINNNPYSTILKERYLKFDAAGVYSFNSLLRAEIADRRSMFELGYPNMSMSYLNANFTREAPNQNKSIFIINQFGKLINNQIIKAVSFVSGTADIELMTLPVGFRPKVLSGIDRMYFTAYVRRVGQSPVRTIPYSLYVIPSTGKIFLQTEGHSINLNGDDLIYINIEYYVR